jgi:hypothetical protein
MNFSDYWKEIAVILAGAFAISSALFDVKDKATGRITIWGRVFFVLTVISIAAGLFVQWSDNEEERTRNQRVQNNMVTLLQKSEQSINELSRLLQPIGNPEVVIEMIIPCEQDEYKTFCVPLKKQGEANRTRLGGDFEGYLDNVDWSTWPKHPYYYQRSDLSTDIELRFFRNPDDAKAFIANGNPFNRRSGDLELDVAVRAEQQGENNANLHVLYKSKTNDK